MHSQEASSNFISPPVLAIGKLTVRKKGRWNHIRLITQKVTNTKVPAPQKVIQINQSLQRSATEVHGPRDDYWSPKFGVVNTMSGLSSNVSLPEKLSWPPLPKRTASPPLILFIFQNNITPDIELYGYLLAACHPCMDRNFIYSLLCPQCSTE